MSRSSKADQWCDLITYYYFEGVLCVHKNNMDWGHLLKNRVGSGCYVRI